MDNTCPNCGAVDNYWLQEASKECKKCGTEWFSAWQLGLNDKKEN